MFIENITLGVNDIQLHIPLNCGINRVVHSESKLQSDFGRICGWNCRNVVKHTANLKYAYSRICLTHTTKKKEKYIF